MSKMRESTRLSRESVRLQEPPPATERKLLLSGLVHRTLVSFNERGQQRRVLLNLLILAQALLMLAAAPAYLSGAPAIVPLATILASLAVCLVAALFNQVFRNPVRAAYVLIGGGAIGVLVLVVVAAVAGNPLAAAHTSLLLVPVMLETGLLFAPEVTLLTVGVSIVVTIAALLFALSINSAGTRQETYGLVVDILGVQIVSGMIAWLLAQFIYDSALEAQRAQEQQFAQARLEAMTAQSAEQHQRLDAAIAAVQQTLGRAINGDYTARIANPDGPLAVLAASLNMLLERLSALSQGDMVRQRMEAAALPLIDVVGRMPDGATPPPASLPVMTDTPLDTVSVAVSQMQASVGRRLSRVQELAGEVVGALAHTHGGVTTTAQTASEALRTVGAAIAAADGMLSAAQRDVDLASRPLRAAGALRPTDAATLAGIPDEMEESAGLEGVGTSLLGLGPDLGVGVPGLTGAFEALSQAEAEALLAAPEADPARPTAETPSQQNGNSNGSGGSAGESDTQAPSPKRPRAAKGAAKAEEPAPAVLELLRLLEQLRDEVGQQERSATTLVHELGLVNRNVRGVDVGVAWARQALEAVRRNAEKLLQTASGANLPPTFSDSLPISVPLSVPVSAPISGPIASPNSGPLAIGGPRPGGPSRPLAQHAPLVPNPPAPHSEASAAEASADPHEPPVPEAAGEPAAQGELDAQGTPLVDGAATGEQG